MLRMVVCDWNGTLFRDPQEEAFFTGLAFAALWRALRKRQFGRVGRLLRDGLEALSLYRVSRARPAKMLECVDNIVRILNRDAFVDYPVAALERYIRNYGRRQHSKLDRRLLTPLSRLRRRGVPVGIISSGCRPGLEAVLRAGGWQMDFVIANEFRLRDDHVEAFDFEIADDKAPILKDVIDRHGLAPAEVMYIGDAWPDEGCFHLAGMPVVSLLAGDEQRRYFAYHCGAEAPRSREEFEALLERFLRFG